jgi:hypothetical protein
LDRIHVAIARVMLQSFQFFRRADKHNSEELLALYTSICSFIGELEEQEETAGLVSHATYYIFQGTILSTCCLLRLLKTPLSDFNTQDGQRFFFKALNLLSTLSLTNEDHPARASTILKNLWRSDKVFKHADGSWNLDLRVRSRFALSTVYDTMWWSHEEFGGQFDPYPQKGVTG